MFVRDDFKSDPKTFAKIFVHLFAQKDRHFAILDGHWENNHFVFSQLTIKPARNP